MDQQEKNKIIVKRFYEEVINERKIELIVNYLSVDFTHNGILRGIGGQTDAVNAFFVGFGELKNEIKICIAEADLVAVHEFWTGVHSGNYMGVPASGKFVSWTSNAILKVREGRITEAWDENDFLKLFREIGKFPEK